MNKPDSYMPMDWAEFWQAVEGQSDLLIVAYLRALSYYWHHTHCAGLRNDSEFLRKICRADKLNWDDLCGILFNGSEYFNLDVESNMWHQKRAQLAWLKVNETYEKRVKQTEAAMAARWPNKKRIS